MADQRCTMHAMAAGAGDDASTGESCSPACIDTLQPFLGDDTRPHRELPRRFVPAISANVLQCTAHCTSPPREPTKVGIWPTYRGEYTRHPPCTYDVRLVQLNTDTCAGFGACAFSALIRRRGKAGPRPPHFHDRCELPGIARVDRGSRPEYDAPVYAGQWLRPPPIRISHAGRDRLTSMRGYTLHVDR